MRRFDNDTISRVTELLRGEVKKIVLIPHLNPDGDAVGSSLGLCHVLNNAGFETTVVTPSDYPAFLKWLYGTEKVQVYEHEPEACLSSLRNSDLIFFLDFNDVKRAGELAEHLDEFSQPKILIDHHPHPNGFADYILSEPDASSTAELIFEFIERCNLTEHLDKDAAEALFTGIITDTGSFSYNASSPRLYEIVGKLLACGADKDKIHASIYYNFSTSRMRLLGYCLDKKMEIFPKYHAALISLTAKELEDYGFQPGDTEGFVNYPLSIKGILFTAFFIEKEGKVKISFRSKENFPTNEFAKSHFNGGGHVNASGGSSELSLEDSMKKFKELLPSYADRLEEESRKMV